jgi:hypothetical protein
LPTRNLVLVLGHPLSKIKIDFLSSFILYPEKHFCIKIVFLACLRLHDVNQDGNIEKDEAEKVTQSLIFKKK